MLNHLDEQLKCQVFAYCIFSNCGMAHILETYQSPDRSYFQEPPELESLVSTGKLPKQADIDKILKHNTKKSSERNTFTCNCEGNTGMLLNQPLL